MNEKLSVLKDNIVVTVNVQWVEPVLHFVECMTKQELKTFWMNTFIYWGEL